MFVGNGPNSPAPPSILFSPRSSTVCVRQRPDGHEAWILSGRFQTRSRLPQRKVPMLSHSVDKLLKCNDFVLLLHSIRCESCNKVPHFFHRVPGVTIATDVICGFPTETEQVSVLSFFTMNNSEFYLIKNRWLFFKWRTNTQRTCFVGTLFCFQQKLFISIHIVSVSNLINLGVYMPVCVVHDLFCSTRILKKLWNL